MSSKPYFDEVAHQWDKMREGFFSEAVREKALAVAGVQRGKVAADLGTGTGFITEGLIREGLQVIAVDESEAMLETMRKKFSSIERIDYRVGEAENLPISSGDVDYAFANMYLHHVAAPPKAIKEMARVLKPEGKLVLTDLDEHHFEFLRLEHHDRWMGFKRQDIQQWLTEAGLKDVVVDCVGEDCCAQSSGGNEYANISVFVASGRK
jgi:ubiquinone/menaquinone biosynthesis C-methylase UbiE